MASVIIYRQDSGIVAIVRPTNEALQDHSVDEIARKDVPEGKRYKIIDTDELPKDWSLRNAWTVDEEILTDGVGGSSNEFD